MSASPPSGNPPGRDFPRRLRGILRERGWTNADAAREGGTSEANIGRWLAGSVPRVRVLEPVARRWGYSTGWLLTGHGDHQAVDPKPETPAELLEAAVRLLRRAQVLLDSTDATAGSPLDEESVEDGAARLQAEPPARPTRKRGAGQ